MAKHTHMHDRVCTQLHINICVETGVKLDKERRYGHVPKSVATSQEGKVTILLNQQVQTDRAIPNNELVIIICDKKLGTCVLIAVSIPGDRNVIKREAEKVL